MHNRVTWCRTNLTVGISALWWKARYSTRCRKTISANISLRLPINRTRIRREILENAKLPVESAAAVCLLCEVSPSATAVRQRAATFEDQHIGADVRSDAPAIPTRPPDRISGSMHTNL